MKETMKETIEKMLEYPESEMFSNDAGYECTRDEANELLKYGQDIFTLQGERTYFYAEKQNDWNWKNPIGDRPACHLGGEPDMHCDILGGRTQDCRILCVWVLKKGEKNGNNRKRTWIKLGKNQSIYKKEYNYKIDFNKKIDTNIFDLWFKDVYINIHDKLFNLVN